MQNPVFDRQHMQEYFLYGLGAAILYSIPVFLFLGQKKYEDFYFLYIGTSLFMFAIFFYALRLVKRPYDSRRTVSMLIAGNLATFVGVVISVVLVIAGFFFYYPDIFSITPTASLIQDSPSTVQPIHPSGLLFMILILTIFGNTAVGAFVSVVTAYIGKKKQTSDEPTSLEKNIP